MTHTSDLAQFVQSTEELPDAVLRRSKQVLIDFLGVAIAGTRRSPADTLRAYADASPATGTATVVDGSTAGEERAAMFNGSYGHGLDFDDTFSSFPLHPTTVVAPAALATGERTDATGSDFLRAYALGVEVLYRVGRSVFPRQYERGFHSTAAVGPLGAATAASVLYDLEADAFRHALGIAASSAGGLRRNFGTTTKPLHAGFAAGAGVRAATLAREGATADPDVLDGETGYGAVMADEAFDPDRLAGDDLVGVEDVALKLYPSAHITHGAMAALERLRERANLAPTDVTSVTATLHPGGRDVLIHDEPSDALEAKFSIQFCLAAVLRSGSPGLAEFTDEYVEEEATREAMTVADVEYDADAVADLGRYGGRVTVETVDGSTLEETTIDAPGSPLNPVDDDRLRRKFHACVDPSSIDAGRLASAVDDLENRSLADVLEPLRATVAG